MANVKFRLRLSALAGSLMILREAKETAALADASARPQDAPGRPNSNWARCYRIQQAGIIRTGPLIGQPMRRPTDRTRALTIAQVRELTNAAAFARAIGRPLNAMLTVAWQGSALFTEGAWSSLQTALMDRLSRHLQRRGIPTAFVWTRERAFGRGAHSHGAIRLDTIAEELVIGEGIETSASAGRLLGLPAWAAISAGNLAAGLLLPAEVRRVVIAADADPSGERAARQAALRWQREGRSVRIARPDKSGRDFNDLLRARELGHV